MQYSFARIFLVALLAVLTLVAIATALLLHFTQEHERQSSQRVPPYAGKLLARQIAAITSDWSKSTQAIAQSPLTLQLLETRDETSRRDQLDKIISLHPHLGTVHIISVEQAVGQKPITEQLTKQQLRILEAARAGQSKAPILHAESLQLSVSEPIRNAGGGASLAMFWSRANSKKSVPCLAKVLCSAAMQNCCK